MAFTIDQEGFRQLPDEGEANIEDGDLVFVVSDGMGGATSGDLASEMITGRLREMIPMTYQQAANNLYPDRPSVLEDCLEQVHASVNAIGTKKPHLSGMGATATILWVTPENAYFGHVGDTRLYQSRDTRLEQLTKDHTRPWAQWKRGEINEREWRTHPRKHILQQAIGAGIASIEPQIGAVPLKAADWYLLCSDGLIDGLWEKHLRRQFEEVRRRGLQPKDATEALLEKSLAESGRDNISLVTVEIK
jgi:protein phosphatase